jgi:hypothetical protein
MIGISGGVVFTFIERMSEGSFISSNSQLTKASSMLYYSFITFTSVGFGDIVPVSIPAKSATLLWAVSGQLYVAFVIASIVGKYSAGNSRK